MSEPTPREVLYALVAAGFIVITAVLIVGAGAASVVPGWWTATISLITVGVGIWVGLNWRKTGPILLLSTGLLVIWVVGTLIVRQ